MAVVNDTWVITHGDTSRSPVFGVCTASGGSVDLDDDWVVRAQARDSTDSQSIVYGWSAGHGIELSTGTVRLSNGKRLDTSTVALTLLPGDFSQLPRDWSGIVEIEIASDSTSSPAQRYTVARLSTRIVPDVTHDVGALIVNPGLPAPSAPAGGVLAGSYPNPVFAVPMASQTDLSSAVATASLADRNRANHTGTQSADTVTDGSSNKVFTTVERAKLAGVATGATANATDTQLRDRTTHTGSMFSTAISDFAEAVQDTMGASFVEGLNISIAYNDANGTFTIAAANQGGQGGGGPGGGVSGVRVTNGNSQAFTNELLKVDASGGPVTINPPPSPPGGSQVTVVKVDASSNHITWNAPTNAQSTYDIASCWSGATFTYDSVPATWTVTAVSAAALTYADITGTVPEPAISSLIARDQEVADAIAASSITDRARTNHTGTQAISTVSGLQTALDARYSVLIQIAPKTNTYTASANEAVPLDTTTNGSFTLTFPSSAPVGTVVAARWVAGAASPIIAAPVGETIGASQTQSMNLAPATTSGEFIVWQKWTASLWLPRDGFKPQAALDARYDARYLANETQTAFRAYNASAQAFPTGQDTVVAFPTASRTTTLVTSSTQGAGHKFTLNRGGLWVGHATVRVQGGTGGEVHLAANQLVAGVGSTVAAMNGGNVNNVDGSRHVSLSSYYDAGTAIYLSLFQSAGVSKNSVPNNGAWCQVHLAWVHP